MTVCMESLFSLPESWTAVGSQHMYSACMPVPVTEEVALLSSFECFVKAFFFPTTTLTNLTKKVKGGILVCGALSLSVELKEEFWSMDLSFKIFCGPLAKHELYHLQENEL